MKVLIAVDGAPSSQNVVRVVAERPWPTPTEFKVVSVVDPFLTAELPALVADAHDAAETILRKAAEELEHYGIRVTTGIPEGHPASAIIETARSFGADLVMLGSHGMTAMPRFLLGSNALHVVRGATCPVEIVRINEDRVKDGTVHAMKILMATDGGSCSLRAAESIAKRPWPAGSEVRVICVPEALTPLLENQISTAAAWEELLAMRLSQARDAVAGTITVLTGGKLIVHGHVPEPMWGPKAVILDEAENWPADLIVVGSHCRRGLDRFWMGSVSEAVALNARCSVEVIRAHEE